MRILYCEKVCACHNLQLMATNQSNRSVFCIEMRATYNKLHVNDFTYFNILGKGTSGIVVHASKKSTGKHYAIKIIQKQALLNEFADNADQVDVEVRILASISHPFIVGMDYSFTTPCFGLIVMELVTGMQKYLPSPCGILVIVCVT